MKKLCFEVKALSNIVIKASSNTQGKIRYLDFLPGSVFLGIVAKNFNKFDNPFEIFFSSKVKFLDANPLNDDSVTYKIPFSFYHKKLDPSKIYNFHFLTSDNFKDENGNLIQYKQIRNGYIDKNLNKKNVKFSYNQKSAIDYKKGRSKESQMFGYRSINKGEKFYFEVLIDESIDDKEVEKIQEFLIGERRIGKSKSAEYAKVEIKLTAEKEKVKSKRENKTYVYFKSRAVLFDDEGNPTYDVRYAFSKDLRDKINYEKSNIRVYSYMPYNYIRRGYDSERFLIDKGSVVVLETDVELDNFVGEFNNEGFGEILINPEFLMETEFELKQTDELKKYDVKQTNLSKYLNIKKEKMLEDVEIIKEVRNFIDKYKKLYSNISNSQWGNIRKIARSFSENFMEKIEEFISHGTKKWDYIQIIELKNAIKTSKNPKKFTILLATEMAKDKK